MSKRLAIVAMYCKTGVASKYIYNILGELRSIAEKLVVVSNGGLRYREKDKIGEIADFVLERENIGFDAGAYKYALLKYSESETLGEYDELILCNDTFFGFFMPLADIFKEMEGKAYDFWGLNRVSNHILEYIESYFLVFRKNILASNCFWEYWKTNINEAETNIDEVYIRFEHEIYIWLCRNNYTAGAWTELNHLRLYEDSFHYISEYQMPLIKKKAFSKEYYNYENLLAALNYIDRETKYDVNIILDEVKKEYNVAITISAIKRYNWKTTVLDYKEMKLSQCTGGDVRRFSEKGKCYIYGAGLYGKLIYRNYVNKENILGFLVSDFSGGKECCEGKKVIPFSALDENPKDVRIILALSADNTKQVLPKVLNCGAVLNLWYDGWG